MKKTILLFFCFVFFLNISFAQWQHTSLDSGMVRHIAKMGSILFAGTMEHGIYKSLDNGITWSLINNGLPYPIIRAIAIKGSKVFIGDNSSAPFDSLGGIFVSNDTGSTWIRVYRQNPDPSGISFLTVHDSTIYAGIGSSGIHKSIDDGLHWIPLADSIPSGAETLRMVVKDSLLIAGTSGSGIYTSIDNGTNWATSNNGLGTQYIYDLAVNNNDVFAGILDGGAFISSDNCSNWTAINNGIPNNSSMGNFVFYSNRIYTTTSCRGVFLSINNGQNWTAVNQGLSDTCMLSLCIMGNTIFAGTGTGVFKRPLSEMTGISEIISENNISVYPNPSSTTLTISTPFQSANAELSIMNIQGHILLKQALTQGKAVVDVSGFAKGMYFVKVNGDRRVEINKFIKN